MRFSGRLEGIAPSDIFQIISQNRMTGTLIARCPDRTAMVVFKDGQVIEATSDAPQESLGHLLVSQGLMSEETIEAARDRLKQEPDRSLGAILVQMGAITEKALETVVFRQIGHIVHRLMSCEDGFITFDRGEMAVKRKLNTREFFLPSGVSAEYLIMDRARVIDEERRRGFDRRAHAAVLASADVPTGEESRAAGAPGRIGAAATEGRLTSWFREIRLTTIENLRGAVGAVVRKGKEFAGAAGDLLRRSVMPWLRDALSKVRAFSPDGKALIYAGAGGIAAGIVVILLTAQISQPPASKLVITGRAVNIRATPSTTAKAVAKTERGEIVSLLSSAEGWYQVRTQAGATGWIWEKLAERKKNNSKAVRYGKTISWFVLLVGLALLIVGIVRRLRASSAAPRASRGSG